MNAASPALAAPPRLPLSLIRPLQLADGRRVLVRPVLPQDDDAEQAFVMALSPASRYRRFHVGMRALPAAVLAQFTRIDHLSHVALVAHAEADDDEPALVADARYVRSADAEEAEFAVAVADDWQRQGLGRQMLALLARHAARHGVRRLHGDVLADNAPMLRMLAALGCEVRPRSDEAGVMLATIAL